jgi:hypothetical protein
MKEGKVMISRVMKKSFYAFALCVFALVGCATTDLSRIPLKYGQELSQDSIKISNYNLQTVSETILKVKDKGSFKVRLVSDNLYQVVETGWSSSIVPSGFSYGFTGKFLTTQSINFKYTFDIILTSAEDGSTIIKAKDGHYESQTRLGQGMAPGTFSKESRELNPQELYYELKGYVLFLEKYLPEVKTSGK